MVPDRGIFVVADGMGGHAAGEVASEMAVRFVARELGSLKGLSDDQVADRMRAAIRAANGAIFQRTLTEHDKRGMGTTVTALVLYDTRFLIGQVGDSRAYLCRDGKLIQLTKDHSYVQEQVDAGYLTPEQARSARLANLRGAKCASKLAARRRPVNGRASSASADDAEPRLQPRTSIRARCEFRLHSAEPPLQPLISRRCSFARAATSSRGNITSSTIAFAGSVTGRKTNTRSLLAERYSSAATRGRPR